MSPSPNPVRFWSAPELWRIEFVLRASRIARVLLIEASSHSGCQAHGGDSLRETVERQNGRACRVALALSAAAGLIAAESRTLTGRIPPVHGRGQRTSAGREPRPAGRRSEGRAQGNSPSGECYRRAIVRPPPSGRGEIAASGAFGCPGRPCRAGESAGRGLFSVPGCRSSVAVWGRRARRTGSAAYVSHLPDPS
ncbi:unnamed protein product [Clavelina lepadiformis]|uniref:Uncharacterized protein n=1 Tax=Clavelina lepadiformis TaxID=159417 RepID=A0ABP0GU78_CLALP